MSTAQQPAPAASERGPIQVAVAIAVRIILVVMAAVLVLGVIYLLRKPLGWLVLAAFIATAVSGPVRLLERRLKRRGFAIAIVYLGVMLTPVLVVAVLVPPLVEQGNNLATNAPQYASDVRDFVQKNSTLKKLNDKYHLTDKLTQQAEKLPGKVGDVASALADIGAGIVSSIFAAVTILILSIFMTGAAPRWRRVFTRYQPGPRAEAINRLIDQIGDAVGAYVRGALLQALIAGVTSYIILAILGVPYPVALSLIVFLLDLVPLVGATIGAVLVGVVTLFNDFPTVTIIWTVWSIVYQQVENTVIQPRIQARAVAVEPFVVLVSVLFGSTLFGVFGALLAIPAAAAIQIIVVEFIQFRRSGRIAGIPASAVTGAASTANRTGLVLPDGMDRADEPPPAPGSAEEEKGTDEEPEKPG